MNRPTHRANHLSRMLSRLLGGEAGAGIILIAAAAAAMILANSAVTDGYHAFFLAPLPWSPVAKLHTLHAWVNDGLMAVFFFMVGLEIKREVLDGELADPARRRLPVAAAAAGMAVPALIYLFTAGHAPRAGNGWAIPAATDIAFALGVLALLGKRVPPSLRLFLLTVAIVDDLGAVAIIALFYTASIKLAWIAGALVFLGLLIGANRGGMRRPSVYLLLGLGLWYCILHSGVHATIAGVATGFTVPLALDKGGDSPLVRLEHALVPWNSYLVVPLFGFANAGVTLTGLAPGAALDPVPLGVALGLFAGKQAGVLGALAVGQRLGLGKVPAGATWPQLWGMAILCGVGFTMSLFIGALAFPREPLLVEEAKLGVLAGSLLSALLGYAVLRVAPPRAG